MPSMLMRIILGAVALLVLVVAVMWVIGLGPFNTRPSAAAKALPKVEKTVAKTQAQAGAAVAQVETKAKTAIATTEKRTESHVARIRAAAPRIPPAAIPDREFFVGVCQSKLYGGSAECRGFSGKPEGRDAGPSPRAVRGG